MEWFDQVWAWLGGALAWTAGLNIEALLQNKWARALGMFAIVWATIWVIALVYSGYARDSLIGPIGLRSHTNKKLGEGRIVFDQSIFPFQMDGVEAACQFYYHYEDKNGKTRRIQVSRRDMLQLHIRVSPIPPGDDPHYGFEHKEPVGGLQFNRVVYPPYENNSLAPETVSPAPATVTEYIDLHKLVEQWTDDDEAPVVSVGPTKLELIADERAQHVVAKAKGFDAALKARFFRKMAVERASNERSNVFGSYYVRMQFSKNPMFVLFRHPNKELKMTAWLTVLTSFFAIAMDLWPVDYVPKGAVVSSVERAVNPPEAPSRPPLATNP